MEEKRGPHFQGLNCMCLAKEKDRGVLKSHSGRSLIAVIDGENGFCPSVVGALLVVHWNPSIGTRENIFRC